MTLSGEVPLDQRIQLVDSFQGKFIQVSFVKLHNKILGLSRLKESTIFATFCQSLKKNN